MRTIRRSAPRLLEAAFQVQVTETAELYGWSWMHLPRVVTRRKRRDGSERFVNETPSKGPLGNGWPDLFLCRERAIFVELKRKGGRPSGAQTLVLGQLREAGCEVYLWDPDDWVEIQRVLSRRPAPSTHSAPATADTAPGPDQGGTP